MQKYFPGKRRNIYFFAARGKVAASVEVEIDRTDRIDGTGIAVEGHTVTPDRYWCDHLQRLTDSLNYDGAGCLQYLVDEETGQSSFLEVNARLGANFVSVLDCGLDLPLWWVQTSLSQKPTISDDYSYPQGRRYTWLYGDLLGLKNALSSNDISSRRWWKWLAQLVVASLRSRTHVTFRWTDPLPTLFAFGALVTAPLSRPLQVTERKLKRPLPCDNPAPAGEYVQR